MAMDGDIEKEESQENQSEFSLLKNEFVSNIFSNKAKNLQEKTERLEESNSLNTTLDLLKDTQFKQKHLDVGLSEEDFENYTQKINDVLRIFLDGSLDDFPVSIIDSIVVGWQFMMMETLSKMDDAEVGNFFWSIDEGNISWNILTTAWSLFKTFGKSWEFLKLAKKFQNFTEFLNMHSGQFDENSTLLNNPYYTFKLMNLQCREDKANLDTLRLENININGKILLDKETDSSNLEMTEEQKQELQAIANNTSWKINKDLIDKINNWALDAATMFLLNRETYKQVASQPLWLLAGLFDKEILWFNAGTQLTAMFGISATSFDDFIAKISTWKNKPIINVVLNFLWISNWIKWLAKEYYKGKIDKIIPDKTQLATIFSSFQKEKDDEITNDDTDSTRKTLKLDTNLSSKTDEEKNILKNTLIPPQLADLNTSLFDNLDNMKIDPKVASEAGLTSYLTNKDDKYILRENISEADKKEFVKKYLLYIIPTIATNFDTTDASMSQDRFTLMILWTLFYGTEFKWAVSMNALSPSLFSTGIIRNNQNNLWLNRINNFTSSDQILFKSNATQNVEDFVVTLYDYAKEVSQEYGIPVINILWQTALETWWGASKLNKEPYNNYFGIKFVATNEEVWYTEWRDINWNEIRKLNWKIIAVNMSTKEEVNWKLITIDARFRAYETPKGSLEGYANLIRYWNEWKYRENITALDWQNRNDPAKIAQAIREGGYATDSGYVNKLINAMKMIDNTLDIENTQLDETPTFTRDTTNMAILWDSVWVGLINNNTRKESSVKGSASFWNWQDEYNLTKRFEDMNLEDVNSCLIFAGLNQKLDTSWIDQNAKGIKETAQTLQSKNIIPVLVKPYMPVWVKYEWVYKTNMENLRTEIDNIYTELSNTSPKPVLIDLSEYTTTLDATQKDENKTIYLSDWLHPTDYTIFTQTLQDAIKLEN